MFEKAGFYFRYFIFILLIISSLLPVSVYAYGYTGTRNILILNSYHRGLSWTDHETEGIMDTIESENYNSAVSVEYMDWKNYPTEENLIKLHDYLKYKYSQRKLDLVVVTDDAALEFALKNREEMFSDAPVVFCGVNQEGVERITRGFTNVTGVVEEIDPEKTVRAAIKINPHIRQIYLLFDNTESGLSTGELTINTIKKINPGIKVIVLNDAKLEDIIKNVKDAPQDSAVLITTYYQDVEGSVAGFEKICRIVSKNSSVPVYSLYDFGMGYGALGGSMLSGRLLGQIAGRIGSRVLNGEDISKIPVDTSKTARYIFDHQQMERFKIPASSVPKGSEIVNEPFSFYKTYRELVNAVAVIIVLLVLFIIVLVHYLRKTERMSRELKGSSEKQAKLFGELQVSDEKLRQQYDELVKVQNSLVASEKKYALLFEKMLNGFFELELVYNNEERIMDVRIINANPGSEKQTNVKRSDMLGKTWAEVFGYRNQNLKIFQDILKTGEAMHFETFHSHVNAYYLVNAFKIANDKIGVVFDNITEYKMAIKKIRMLNEELEHRVAERTSELKNAVNELESFTYTVSHDLKSPLRAIDGYSKIITEDYESKLGNEGTELINSIRVICNDMTNMIEKLLHYCTTSRLDIMKEEINIEEMFLSTYNELKLSCPVRDVKLKIETGLPRVMGDRVLLKEAVSNIFSNAFKFTRQREKAVITVGGTITENEYVFYVKDNGAGFDMEYSGKLFGIFQRLHTSEEFEGSGIGLVTVKKVIQKHGGRTWIEGKVDEGVTVYFTLPFE